MSHAEERNTLQPVSVNACKSRSVQGLIFSQTWDVLNINKNCKKQIHFVEVVPTLELIFCPEFDCCNTKGSLKVEFMLRSCSSLIWSKSERLTGGKSANIFI